MASVVARGALGLARYAPYIARGARAALGTPGRRKAFVASTAKFLTWANRRKIASGYNKYAKPTVKAVVGKRLSRRGSRRMTGVMKSYRRTMPKGGRYAMANW